MIFSKYLLKIPINRGQLLLVGLHLRNAIIIEQSTFDAIADNLLSHSNLPDDTFSLVNELMELKIIVKRDTDELNEIAKLSLASRVLNNTFSAIVIPTMSCNLRCSYCFQSHKDHASGLTSTANMQIIEYLRSQLQNNRYRNLHIRWFGGEPLLSTDSIKLITKETRKLCKELNLSYSADLVTNGTMLNENIARELQSLGIKEVQVTFDGNREIHNRIRTGPNDKTTYDQLISNIEVASQYLNIRARIHVAPYNLDGIDELLTDLTSLNLQKRLKNIYFAPLFNYKQNKKHTAFTLQELLFMTSKEFSLAQVDLHYKALNLGFTLPDPLDSDFGICTALRENTVTINADGSLVKCYMDAGDKDESFGDIWGNITDIDKLSTWRKYNFANDTECSGCKMVPICLGGCAKQALKASNKKVVCSPLKYNYKKIIPMHLLSNTTNNVPVHG